MRFFRRSIGRDIDGKKLYAGDTVTVVFSKLLNPKLAASRLNGKSVFKVVGPCDLFRGTLVEIDAPHPQPHWKWWSIPTKALKKLKPPEKSSWEEVAKDVGWTPGKTAKPREEVPA